MYNSQNPGVLSLQTLDEALFSDPTQAQNFRNLTTFLDFDDVKLNDTVADNLDNMNLSFTYDNED